MRDPINLDVDVDTALSINWGGAPLQGSYRAPFGLVRGSFRIDMIIATVDSSLFLSRSGWASNVALLTPARNSGGRSWRICRADQRLNRLISRSAKQMTLVVRI